MRRLFDERGAVSVFLLVVFVTMFLFHAVVIDLLRLQAAQADLESTVRSAGRSLISRFEPKLNKYGLFGAEMDTPAVRHTLQQTIGKQLNYEHSSAFSLFDLEVKPEQLQTEPLYHLGDHRVFHEQVKEKMKYIAGVEFLREVADKLQQGRSQIAQAHQYAALSKRLEQLLNKREDELDEAWSITQQFLRVAESLPRKYKLGDEDAKELSERYSRQLQMLTDSIGSELDRAAETNRQIARELLDYPKSKAGSGSVETYEPDTVLPHVRVYEQQYFSSYKAGLGAISSMNRSLANAAESDNEERFDRAKTRMREKVAAWSSDKRAEESRRQDEERKLQELKADSKRSAEKEMERKRDNWKDACRLDDVTDYASLQGDAGLFSKYRLYNEHLSYGAMDEMAALEDVEEMAFGVLDLLNRISDRAAEVRESMLVNEYALTFFTYRTYDKYRYIAALDTRIGDRSSHRLQEQEAEYILYGFPACELNIAAAQSEMFAVRAALRTVEALAKPKAATAAGSPILVLLAAFVEGVRKANDDMDSLLAGEAVELPLLTGVTMNYKDHLRLFFMLHGDEPSMLSRMQALIELNTGLDLMNRFTAVRVKSERMIYPIALPYRKPIHAEAVISY